MRQLVFLFAVTSATSVIAEKPAIQRLDLFKNGIAVVHAMGATDEDGASALDSISQFVHGTFWVDCAKPVTAKIELREEESSVMPATSLELLAQLAGEEVTLHLEGGVAVSGKLMESSEEGKQPIILKSDAGYEFVQPEQILRVQFEKVPEPISTTKSVPTLTFDSEEAVDFSLTYLTRGISWMPSYFIDLSDPKTLKLSQTAAIRNEMANFENVELRLISGYPSIKFSDANSVFAPLDGANSNFGSGYAAYQPQRFDNSLTTQQLTNGYVGRPAAAAGDVAPILGESRDLHYESIGSHSLKFGESLDIPVANAEAEYQRVIDWKIPDTRDEYGRPIEDGQWDEDEEFDKVPWDAVSFQNPFEFPMTTASVTLKEGDQFQGQQRISWTNPGATTCVRITKALSIGAKSFEREIPDTRKEVEVWWGRHYIEVDVEGTLEVSNHRAGDAVVDIQRRFSGKLLSADHEPTSELLEEGIYSQNQRNQLSWSITVPGGEKVILNYRYRVYVCR